MSRKSIVISIAIFLAVAMGASLLSRFSAHSIGISWSTEVSQTIRTSPTKYAAVREALRMCPDRSDGWYCASVAPTPATALDRIAPDCDFVRVYFKRGELAKAMSPRVISRRILDIAVRRSDGAFHVVLGPFGLDPSRYPEFLVWAKCRITSETDAESVLYAMLESTEQSHYTDVHARRIDDRHWSIWWGDVTMKPYYEIETDQQGLVIKATRPR